MNEMIVVIGILWMTCIGFAVIKLFGLFDNTSDIEKLPYSFGLGVGIIAMQLYIYSRLNLPWNLFPLLIPGIILFVILLYYRKSIWIGSLSIKNDLSILDKVIIFFVILLAIFVIIESFIRPVTAWDGWASWLLRAKMFFIAGSVKLDIFTYVPSEYPLLVSLMTAFLYIFLGAVDDRSILLLYPAFYLFLGLLFFLSIRKILGKSMALYFTFLLLSIQNIIRHSGRFEAGQADMILGFYIFTSTALFFRYMQSKKIGNLVLLQIFFGITVLIKNEGVPFVILSEILLTIFLFKKKLYKHFFTFLFWIVPFVDWQIFKYTYNLPDLPSYLQFRFHPERISLIILEFAKEFINVKNWNLLWPGFIMSFAMFLFFVKKNIYIFVLYILIFTQICVYMSVFFFTSADPKLHIPNVANRVLLHIAPIALYAMSLSISLIKIKTKS